MNRKAKGTKFERDLKHALEEKGFYVVRASGSGSDGISPDLIALHTTKKFAVECKAWKNNLFIDREKMEVMKRWMETTGLQVYVAWRHERKTRLFPLLALNETPTGYSLSEKMMSAGMTIDDVLNS